MFSAPVIWCRGWGFGSKGNVMSAARRGADFGLRQIRFTPRQIEAVALFCSRLDCDFVYSRALAAQQSPCALTHKISFEYQLVTRSSKTAFEGRNLGRWSPQIWPYLPAFLHVSSVVAAN
jgi:hypothetical protein